jgi:glucokinase
MSQKNGLALGVDCGGTNMKLALVRDSGQLVSSRLVPVDYRRRPAEVVREFGKQINAFLQEEDVRSVRSVGFGIAGEVDQKNGVVRFSPNLGWNNVPLKKLLSRYLRFPVLIDNDANCAAWGAYWLDARGDCDDLVCLTLGTGVGGGIIIGGRLYRGATGSAGELGHMSICYEGRACKCGGVGCIEALIGAWGLIQTAQSALKKGQAPLLRKMLAARPGSKVEPKTLAEAAGKGDAFCRKLWRDAGTHLGYALSNYINIFNPGRIVLCGGVSKAGDLILGPALQVVRKRAFKTPARTVKITVSRHDQNLGVVGAALLSRE